MMLRETPQTDAPLVSVTIPVFNAEAYVADALASVLAQQHPALEVIVVDDGSTDRSLEAVRRVADSRCRVMRQPQSGAAAARNLGVAESGGALLAFLDADDVWPANKLELQVRALENDPGLDMVFGHYVSFGEGGELSAERDAQPGYSLGTMLIRRARFLDVGPLATRWRVGEFIEWYARAEDAGLRHAMLPEMLLRRRVHETNMTGSDPGALTDYVRIVREIAARRARCRYHL